MAAVTGLLTVGGVLTNPSPAAAAPGVPTGVTAVAGRRAILVSWTAPTGGGVGHYHVVAGSESCDTTSTSCTVPNLTANTAYTATVAACTSATLSDNTDCSAAVPAASVTPGPPGTPAAPAVVFKTDPNTVTLTWPMPDPGAGIASYKIAATPADALTGTCGSLVSAPTRTCDFSGLVNDTSYTFKVTAIGITTTAGTTGTSAAGPASAAKVAGKPHVPAKPTVTRDSDTAVIVGWSKPSGGQALSGYTVSVATGNGAALPGTTCLPGPDDTECRVAGLAATGSYTFTVAAKGELPDGGVSNASAASDPIIPGLPGAMSQPYVELGAVAGDVSVSWDPPADGGAPTSYVVTPDSPDGGTLPATCAVTVTHCDFHNLQNGKSYRFKVTAANAAGSQISPWSDSIVSQLPDKPATPTAVLGDAPGKVVLNWAAATTGGPVVYYGVTAIPASGNAIGTKTAGCGFNLTTPTCTITGLDPAVSYTFQVTAVGDLGFVDSDPSNAVLPNKPGMPGSPVVVLGQNPDEATVNWSAATGGGVVAGYTVTAIPSDDSAEVVGCDAVSAGITTCAFTGLDPDKLYAFTVRAANPAGNSDAVATATTPNIPSAPQAPAVALQDSTPGAVDVSWSAPATGTATRYVVTAASSDSTTLPALCKVDAPAEICSFQDLDTTKHYTFTVRAENLLGGTNAAATSPIVPDKPGVPASVVVTVTAPGAATVTWAAPAAGGAVAEYTVAVSSTDGNATIPADCMKSPTAVLSCDFSLDNDMPYVFTVTATNAAGSTPTPATDPVLAAAAGAPTGVQAQLGNAPGTIVVSWVPPTGTPVTGYQITPASNAGGAVLPTTCGAVAPTALSCTYTGLTTTAPYTFVVRALNDAGGANAAATAALIPDKPGAPTTVVAVRGGAPGMATVTWAGPTGGGGDVAGYAVTPVSADTAAFLPAACTKGPGDTLSCTFDTLTPNKPYTFTVSASNAAGHTDTVSTPPLIPNKPEKPAGVTVNIGAPGSATVTWGSPIGADVSGGWVVTPASADGGATPSPATCTVTASAERTCTFTGLTTTATYTFTVRATNSAGSTDSDSSAPFVANKPNAPSAPAAEVISGTSVRLTWIAPGSGGPITNYSVTAYTSTAPDTAVTSAACAGVTALTCDFDGLSEAATYTFRVTSTGSGGSNQGDRSKPVTTAAPGKPAAPVVELNGPNAVKIIWTPPDTGGPVTSFSVTSAPDLSAPARCTQVRASSCVFDRLQPGVAYTFRVLANGTADRSAESDASVSIVPGPPAAPAPPMVAPGDTATAVVVSWMPPGPGGPVAGFQVQSTPGSFGCAAAPGAGATSCVVTGLDAKTSYTFKIKAIGVAGGGDSEFSPSSVAIVPGAAPVPGDVVVAGGDRQIDVSWIAPTDTSRIDHYRAVTAPGGFACETATGSPDTGCVIVGVTNLAVYTVTVTSIGKDGTISPPSPPSGRVRPSAGRPGTPGNVQATVADGQTVVSWTAPGSTGDGVSRYIATAISPTGAWQTCATPNATTLTCTINGLVNGATYAVTVVSAGVAAGGYSDPSPAVMLVPTKPPATVTGVAVVGGVKTLTVSWKAPTTTDGLTGFVATATSAGITSVTCTAVVTATTCSMSNLTPAVYSVTVVAKGATVSSAPSTAVEATAITAVAPTLPSTLPTSGGTLTITGTPKAGSTVIVNGTGLAPFTGVTIGLYSPLVKMATVNTDAKGGFTVEVTIPAGNTGSKTIVAGGQSSATSTTVKYLTAAVTVA